MSDLLHKAVRPPLTGPTCPHCGTAFRRRRVWCRFDTAICRTCWCRAERTDSGDAAAFVFSGPDPRWRSASMMPADLVETDR